MYHIVVVASFSLLDNIPQMSMLLFTHSPADENSDCFQILAILTNAAIKIRFCLMLLIWLDCRELCNRLFGCADQQRLVHLFIRKAGLALNDGAAFGPGGEGYMRLNVGCGLEVLQEAMKSLKTAIDEY